MRIDVVTVGRSDYGILRPLLARLAAEPAWDVGLVVSGGHLNPLTGVSMEEILKDGYAVRAAIPLTTAQSGAAAMAECMAQAMQGLSRAYADRRPDLMFVLGDRYEMFAIAAASVPFNIALAHIHGGELSFGAIDEVFRHAITKMAHLHFASTADYADRIVRMGEEPWRVTASGAPGLDAIANLALPSRAELAGRYGLDLAEPPLMVVFHPVTRQSTSLDAQIDALVGALAARREPIILVAPNLDYGHERIRAALADFVAARPRCRIVENFSQDAYFGLMREALALVGNSSSGIIEAASFQLPVLNIGDRQDGRIKPRNVVDVPCTSRDIAHGLDRVTDPVFRKGLSGLVNPYGRGDAALRIVAKLKSVRIDDALIAKRFYDGQPPAST